jgi:hypothetical protein
MERSAIYDSSSHELLKHVPYVGLAHEVSKGKLSKSHKNLWRARSCRKNVCAG